MELAPAAIEIRNLRKLYGDKAAVDGLTLTVPQGCFFGFLGPNGAGKTTTIKMLMGLRATLLRQHRTPGPADARARARYQAANRAGSR